ncbi:MAG: conserved hypothetical protein [Arenicellales bacterium IbO2]|nr:hypothetical protein [Gammaproteobacteria bacterium]MDA7962406.1 hypothetical protein [Gammaproteobacteria bacterium]CAJ2377663.1 MAG: conserved hypothetical protein [Arenicellales bacterium IbO2]
MPNGDNGDKRVIGLYGEMALAMELHARGWQVYRAYIDEQVDFVIARYYCTKCKDFSGLEKRAKGKGAFPTDLCQKCKTKSLRFVFRLIQVKASEGVDPSGPDDARKFSFHAKLRSNVDDRAFYAWIAIFKQGPKKRPKSHFFIFHHKDIERFDDLELDSYQKTDNQKTTLRISPDGTVKNRSLKGYDYDAFNSEFRDAFGKFKDILPIDIA